MFVLLFAELLLFLCSVRDSDPSQWLEKEKVAAPPPSVFGKLALPIAAGEKGLYSQRLESTTQEYLPALARKQLSNLHENADLWDVDTLKARKAAVDLNKACTSQIDLSCFDKVDFVEISEMLMLNAAQVCLHFLVTENSYCMFLSVGNTQF